MNGKELKKALNKKEKMFLNIATECMRMKQTGQTMYGFSTIENKIAECEKELKAIEEIRNQL